MKLLLDMNLSKQWVPVLEEAGFHAVHWSSIGAAISSDTQIMEYAKANGYSVCTQDLDFGLMLASSGEGKRSVLQIRAQGVLPHQIGEHGLEALRKVVSELEMGALVTVDPKRTRLRVLPLKPRER